ncbi:MAG: hypothetical protein NTV88_00120 [Candidatus Micrarchaeota archaeon]|nr:hypothetical protein [Candidatus Micrarchaeota archaeon]
MTIRTATVKALIVAQLFAGTSVFAKFSSQKLYDSEKTAITKQAESQNPWSRVYGALDQARKDLMEGKDATTINRNLWDLNNAFLKEFYQNYEKMGLAVPDEDMKALNTLFATIIGIKNNPTSAFSVVSGNIAFIEITYPNLNQPQLTEKKEEIKPETKKEDGQKQKELEDLKQKNVDAQKKLDEQKQSEIERQKKTETVPSNLTGLDAIKSKTSSATTTKDINILATDFCNYLSFRKGKVTTIKEADDLAWEFKAIIDKAEAIAKKNNKSFDVSVLGDCAAVLKGIYDDVDAQNAPKKEEKKVEPKKEEKKEQPPEIKKVEPKKEEKPPEVKKEEKKVENNEEKLIIKKNTGKKEENKVPEVKEEKKEENKIEEQPPIENIKIKKEEINEQPPVNNNGEEKLQIKKK